MDISELRIIATVASFVLFIGIMVWVWRNRKSKDFEDAAQLPFQQED